MAETFANLAIWIGNRQMAGIGQSVIGMGNRVIEMGNRVIEMDKR